MKSSKICTAVKSTFGNYLISGMMFWTWLQRDWKPLCTGCGVLVRADIGDFVPTLAQACCWSNVDADPLCAPMTWDVYATFSLAWLLNAFFSFPECPKLAENKRQKRKIKNGKGGRKREDKENGGGACSSDLRSGDKGPFDDWHNWHKTHWRLLTVTSDQSASLVASSHDVSTDVTVQ